MGFTVHLATSKPITQFNYLDFLAGKETWPQKLIAGQQFLNSDLWIWSAVKEKYFANRKWSKRRHYAIDI